MNGKSIMIHYGQRPKYTSTKVGAFAQRVLRTARGIGKEYTEVLNKLTEADKDLVYKLHESTVNTAIFSLMQIFEEQEEFKIVYEKNGKQIDLNKISELLKSEHHKWIQRFSKESNNGRSESN